MVLLIPSIRLVLSSVWLSDVAVQCWDLHLGTGMCDGTLDRCGRISGIGSTRGLPRRTAITAIVSDDRPP